MSPQFPSNNVPSCLLPSSNEYVLDKMDILSRTCYELDPALSKQLNRKSGVNSGSNLCSLSFHKLRRHLKTIPRPKKHIFIFLHLPEFREIVFPPRQVGAQGQLPLIA